MGLDGVELIIAVEEKFGISISDPEAQSIVTVADMKNLVRTKLQMVDQSACLTQRAFHLIRRTAIAEFGLPRRNLRLDTLLEDVIPRTDRRNIWQHFQLALGVAQLPELVRPNSVTVVLAGLILSSMIITIWLTSKSLAVGFGYALLLGFVAAGAVGWASTRVTVAQKKYFANGYSRVRDLAQYVVARYPQALGNPRTTKWTEEEMWCLLREIIMEQLGVSRFDEQSRFVKDLHLD